MRHPVISVLSRWRSGPAYGPIRGSRPLVWLYRAETESLGTHLQPQDRRAKLCVCRSGAGAFVGWGFRLELEWPVDEHAACVQQGASSAAALDKAVTASGQSSQHDGEDAAASRKPFRQQAVGIEVEHLE